MLPYCEHSSYIICIRLSASPPVSKSWCKITVELQETEARLRVEGKGEAGELASPEKSTRSMSPGQSLESQVKGIGLRCHISLRKLMQAGVTECI